MFDFETEHGRYIRPWKDFICNKNKFRWLKKKTKNLRKSQTTSQKVQKNNSLMSAAQALRWLCEYRFLLSAWKCEVFVSLWWKRGNCEISVGCGIDCNSGKNLATSSLETQSVWKLHVPGTPTVRRYVSLLNSFSNTCLSKEYFD